MITAYIEGFGADSAVTSRVRSVWSYDDDDPWAVSVCFLDQEITWAFSLELLREAVSGYQTSHGIGDVVFSRVGSVLYVELRTSEGAARLSFLSLDIETFLAQVDDRDAQETVSAALDEWLETLA